MLTETRDPHSKFEGVPRGYPAKEQKIWLRGALERTVAGIFAIERERINQPTRGAQSVAQARQMAMYLAHVALGLSMRDAGEMFDRDRTTVSHAVRMIEDKRDCEDFDLAMTVLEELVRLLAVALESDGDE